MAGIILSQSNLIDVAENPVMRGLAPIQSILSQITHFAADSVNGFGEVKELKSENERQRREIERLNRELAGLIEAVNENKTLRALLKYKEANPEWDIISARVIGYDPTNLAESIIIDRGTKDGLQKGMVVIADGGLTGRIAQVFDNSAKVLLIVDPSSAVNAMVQRSRAQGIICGLPGGELEMRYVQQGKDITEGDPIITSGHGGSFPKGILIGFVSEMSGNDLDLFKNVKVKSMIKFDELEMVLVITNFLPTKLE